MTRSSGPFLWDSASGGLHPVFSSPVWGRHGHPQASSTEATRMIERQSTLPHNHIWEESEKIRFILPEGEGWEESLFLFRTTHWKDMEKTETEVCSNRKKATGSTAHRKFWLDIRIFFSYHERSQTLAREPKMLRNWHPSRHPKLSGVTWPNLPCCKVYEGRRGWKRSPECLPSWN